MKASERLNAIRALARRRRRAKGRIVSLSAEDIVTIRRAALAGESVPALAERYGVTPEQVRRCVYNTLIPWGRGPVLLPDLTP